jgi:hypothetical protein
MSSRVSGLAMAAVVANAAIRYRRVLDILMGCAGQEGDDHPLGRRRNTQQLC